MFIFPTKDDSISEPKFPLWNRLKALKILNGKSIINPKKGANSMSIPAIQKVAINIRRCRTKLGMSASELSRRAGVSKATVTRLEAGQISNPQASNLVAIADVLSVTVGDLMGDSTRRTAASLPTLAPYLRTKYKDLPEDALQEIESHFNDLAARHGIAPSSGPAPHEDEQ